MKSAKTSPDKSQVEMPFVEPMFYVPVIRLPQPNGDVLIRAGKPQILEAEVTIKTFHKETGISIRHIETLCEQGLIIHRRLTPKKKSKMMIPRSELERYKKLEGEI